MYPPYERETTPECGTSASRRDEMEIWDHTWMEEEGVGPEEELFMLHEGDIFNALSLKMSLHEWMYELVWHA